MTTIKLLFALWLVVINNQTAFADDTSTTENLNNANSDTINKRPLHHINYDAMMVRKVSSENINSHSVSGGNIYFEVDKAIIVPTEHIKVEEIAKAIDRLKNRIEKVVIEGIASQDGDPKRNFNLGIERAKAVKKALVALNIDANMIETISYGEAETYRFQNINKNRRAQIRIFVK